MNVYLEKALEILAAAPRCGYHAGQSVATEPTALAALALLRSGRTAAAEPAVAWLAKRQSPDGSLGVTAELAKPCWPTGLAVLAWTQWGVATEGRDRKIPYRDAIRLATQWMVTTKGETFTSPENQKIFGHDCSLVGWPWVRGTHSWVEPTAIQLLALRALGMTNHPRARQAEKLLRDRLLPDGGCNYGNTRVWDHMLRAHIQPTGLALLALAGMRPPDPPIERSVAYLGRAISSTTSAISLSWAVLALTAHGQRPDSFTGMLDSAAQRTLRRDRSPHALALLALAYLGRQGLGGPNA